MKHLRLKITVVSIVLLTVAFVGRTNTPGDTLFCTHPVVLDKEGKILPWFEPHDKAYDHFLDLRWDFIKNHVPDAPDPVPRSNYLQYYFYASFKIRNDSIVPDLWMNDIAEKIPNWFENARLYYAYTGDTSVMTLVKNIMDYYIAHGTSLANFAWPNFPYTTTNAGDTIFQGFTSASRFKLHEIQVDHAGDMGFAYFRMYLYSGDNKYLQAAINVADVLAKYARTGTATQSVWPYRVIMSSGTVTAEYGANWTGCYMLLDNLIKAGLGNVNKYREACAKAKEFILKYPMNTGYWTDGHSDTDINSNTYKSNMSASNTVLCMFDYPELDPEWRLNIPKLIKWTEDYFVFRSAPGEPSTMWGANIVGEQDSFMYKMDYQTARYAAECARWYSVSGDESYKEKAFRALNFVTYCNDTKGMAFESPFSTGIFSWWSDCYGECPRMFYHAFAAMPEWAPPGENHILYSEGVLKNVNYTDDKVEYTAINNLGEEYLRLAFKPVKVGLNGESMNLVNNENQQGYILKDLGNNDFSVIVNRSESGVVTIE